MPKQQGQFVVDMGGIKLTEETRTRIARSLQRAVMIEIARMDEAPRVTVQMTPPQDSDVPDHGLVPVGIWVDDEPEAEPDSGDE